MSYQQEGVEKTRQKIRESAMDYSDVRGLQENLLFRRTFQVVFNWKLERI